jgi:hypothetical protein
MKSILFYAFLLLSVTHSHSQSVNITHLHAQKDVNYHHYKIELSEPISEVVFQKLHECLIKTGYLIRIEWQDKMLVITADKLLSENLLIDELKFLKLSFLSIIDNYSVEVH